jgi:D-sedoheptulose 7-phosphate isomerase
MFTTSGKSRNIVRALEESKKQGRERIYFLRRDGGFAKGMATFDMIAPGNSTARMQQAHKLLFHMLCEMVELNLPK